MQLGVILSRIGQLLLFNIHNFSYSGMCYNERCYNEQFSSIKSGCYNEHRCYNERGRILSADVARAYAWLVGLFRLN